MSTITIAPSRPLSGAKSLGRRLRRLFASLELALQVRAERRMLQALDARALKDLGVSAGDAASEAGRAFFDLPQTRRRG